MSRRAAVYRKGTAHYTKNPPCACEAFAPGHRAEALFHYSIFADHYSIFEGHSSIIPFSQGVLFHFRGVLFHFGFHYSTFARGYYSIFKGHYSIFGDHYSIFEGAFVYYSTFIIPFSHVNGIMPLASNPKKVRQTPENIGRNARRLQNSIIPFCTEME